jgi:uncharacterized membrane protein
MNRLEYIDELGTLLSSLPAKERDEILYDIGEHFDAALSQGKVEEDIIKGLGMPAQVAEQYVPQYPGDALVRETPPSGTSSRETLPLGASPPRGRSVAGYALTVTGLGFVTLSIVLPLMVSWAAVVFSLVVTGISLVLGGLAAVVALALPQIFGGMAGNGFSYTINLLVMVALLSFGGIWTLLSIDLKWMRAASVAVFNAFRWDGGGKG